jgi:hypothetical protein
VEAASTWKRKWLPNHLSSSGLYRSEAGFEIIGIENHEGAAPPQLPGLMQPTNFTVDPLDSGILRAVVIESPAKSGSIKPLGFRKIVDRELHVVDFVMFVHQFRYLH